MKQKLVTSSIAISLSIGILGQGVLAATKFKDIPNPQSHWAYDTVYWAVDNGLTKGYQDGTFKPNNYVTEAEFLALLLNTFPNVSLTNLTSGHWADKFYEYAHQYELPLSQIRNQPITRGLVARLITATLGFDYNQNRSIEYLFEIGLSNGKTGKKTIEDYQSYNKMTRAEALQFIKNLNEKYSSNPKFVGLKPIGGKYEDFLRKVKNNILEKGYDIIIKEDSGDFNINYANQTNTGIVNETVITYSRSSSAEGYNLLFINKIGDKNITKLSNDLMLLIGVPIDDTFQYDVIAAGINGDIFKKYYGDYSLEFQGDRKTEKVTIRFRKLK